MRRKIGYLSALMLTAFFCRAAEEKPLPVLDFEDNSKWSAKYGQDFISLSDVNPAEGKKCLKIADTSYDRGSGIESIYFPASRGGVKLKGKIRVEKGFGCSVRVRFYDQKKKELDSSSIDFGSKAPDDQWHDFEKAAFSASEKTSFVKIEAYSWGQVEVTFMLDDLRLEYISPAAVPPKWTPKYKLTSADKKRLTPADVIGPDGIAYPNWSRAGLQDGFPAYKKLSVNLQDFGAKTDDNMDDSNALQQACDFLATKGGGNVILSAGTYHLDRPVVINASNIYIKGQGPDKTRFISRYSPGKDGIEFYKLTSGDKIGPNTPIWVHCIPKDLMSVELVLDGKQQFVPWKRSMHSGNAFHVNFKISALQGNVSTGKHQLVTTAIYKDGSKKQTSLQVNYDPGYSAQRETTAADGVIMFEGKGFSGQQYLLSKDAERGSIKIELKEKADLKPGDIIRIVAPQTPRWNQEVSNACNWGTYRDHQVLIKGISGKTVTLDQPLRLDFPIIDGTFIEKMESLENCGAEGFSFIQTTDIWMTSVLFKFAINCSARNIKVEKCGRHPVYFYFGKFCEISDCVFDDAHYKLGGGTAYVGWERCYDCLMTNVTTYKMRHAPLFQWSASGNVIRKGTFYDSDAQWHSGWTSENLFEDCKITSVKGNGGYGFGMWASPPEDGSHGPNGPRNVIYNCDTSSPLDGLWIGGMNENWLIMYNRFKINDKGSGVLIKSHSFDHIIKGNVFILKNKAPMVYLKTPDCSGVEIIDNKLYGGDGVICYGLGIPQVMKGNAALKYDENAPRPNPAVPSIFEWQREQIKHQRH